MVAENKLVDFRKCIMTAIIVLRFSRSIALQSPPHVCRSLSRAGKLMSKFGLSLCSDSNR